MIGIGINNINALIIPGYNRKAFATDWMSVGNAMPGKRFICVLYMSKVNPHQDFLLEIQSCDTKRIFDLNCRKVLEHSHLIDRSTLERILDADANGFELVEVQGRTLVRFKFLNLIEKRPSERIILHSRHEINHLAMVFCNQMFHNLFHCILILKFYIKTSL